MIIFLNYGISNPPLQMCQAQSGGLGDFCVIFSFFIIKQHKNRHLLSLHLSMQDLQKINDATHKLLLMFLLHNAILRKKIPLFHLITVKTPYRLPKYANLEFEIFLPI